MKGTDHFKRTIQMYLEQRAEEDALFAKNYRNPAKNIDDCVTYILNYVVELTAEEKAEARQNAIRQYQEEEVRKLQNRNKPRTATKATAQPIQEPSLFDLGL